MDDVREPQYLLSIPMNFPVPSEKERYTLGAMPMHCTVMYWFSCSEMYTLDELIDDVETQISKTFRTERNRLITLTSKQREMFGPKNETPVHVLEYNPVLIRLHNCLYECLTRRGCYYKEKKWVGEGYRAHVSDTSVGILTTFHPGSWYAARHIQILRRHPTYIEVAKVIPFDPSLIAN